MNRTTRHGIVIAFLLLAVLALAKSLADTEGERDEQTFELRITAQRLADGRTEFALQSREPGQSQGERLLPRGRYFPAHSSVGRWLNSTPVTLGDDDDALMAGEAQSGVVVRITARLLDDGRIEFAVQQRESGGQWGDRQLPRSRYFPENASVGRWLSSSPLAVGAQRDAVVTSPSSAQAETPTNEPRCVLTDHVDRLTGATFQVITESGTGSAFYIGQDEWLTNHHVVASASQVQLVRGDYTIIATVIGSLPDYDLALLRAPAPFSVEPLQFATDQQTLGEGVSVIGFPTGVSGTPSLTRGVISKQSPLAEFASFSGVGTMVQIDAAINPGNSGGPMINDCGEVVGIATLKLFTTVDGRDVEGIGYGVSAATVAAQLPVLRVAAHLGSSVGEEEQEQQSPKDDDLYSRIEGHDRAGDLSWLHFVDEELGPLTGVQVIGETDHRVWSKIKLLFSCSHERRAAFVTIQVGAFASDTGEWFKTNSLGRYPFTLSVYSVSPAPLDGATWGLSVDNSEIKSVSHQAATSFFEIATAHAKVAFRVGHVISSIFGLVRLEGAFGTPVQHLLERCFVD